MSLRLDIENTDEYVVLCERVATEFATKEELQKYRKEHPDADMSKHTVKKKGPGGLRGLGQGLKEKFQKGKAQNKIKNDFTTSLMSESKEKSGVWDSSDVSVAVSGKTLDVKWPDGDDLKHEKVNLENPESNPEGMKSALKKVGLWDKVVDVSKKLGGGKKAFLLADVDRLSERLAREVVAANEGLINRRLAETVIKQMGIQDDAVVSGDKVIFDFYEFDGDLAYSKKIALRAAKEFARTLGLDVKVSGDSYVVSYKGGTVDYDEPLEPSRRW